MNKRKIIKKHLPIVTKKLLDADYVQVWWEDINSNAAWLKLEEAKASKPTVCISTGWLVREDKEEHIVVADVNFEDNGSLGDVGGITTIPSKNVLKIKRIKL
jgi:hypothetical protein|tara:strand:+ start:181 stop:486 length:306 start_codon:yes stop_codon:yes gene_type:complete